MAKGRRHECRRCRASALRSVGAAAVSAPKRADVKTSSDASKASATHAMSGRRIERGVNEETKVIFKLLQEALSVRDRHHKPASE